MNEEEILFAIPVRIDGRRQTNLKCISNDGNVRWDRVYNSDIEELIYAVLLLNDSTILLHIGWYLDADSWSNNLVRFDQNGDIVSTHAWHIPMRYSLGQMNDGRIIIPVTVPTDQYHRAPAVFVTNISGDSITFIQYEEQLYLGTVGAVPTIEGDMIIYCN